MNPSSDQEVIEENIDVDEEGEESESESIISWKGLSPQNTISKILPNPEPEHVRNAKWNARIVERLRKTTCETNVNPENDDAKSIWSLVDGDPGETSDNQSVWSIIDDTDTVQCNTSTVQYDMDMNNIYTLRTRIV